MQKSYKSSNFLKVIDKYTKRQKSKITDEIKEHEEAELKKAEAEITEDTNNMIQKELLAMKNKIAIEISHKELYERKKLSLRRKEMMEDIFGTCREKLLSFTNDSEKYTDYLRDCAKDISEILMRGDTVLYVRAEDMKYNDVIKEAFGRQCRIEVDDSILIGGIRGYSEVQGLIADETFDEKLKEQTEWAAETFGIRLV
ncbi:MAG: hypothetical protein IKE41_02170 [Clostridia bacterium]|nr:hypothetical protein [Clostridia bacterium]